MGMLALNRLMSLQSDRPRRQQGGVSGRRLSASRTGKRKGSPCQQDDDGDDSQSGKIRRTAIKELPEDILFRIHSLMPMREAARAACASHAFLNSWRYHPNLIFDKDTIGLEESVSGEKVHHKIDCILREHKGSLKTFKLDYAQMNGLDDFSYLDSWLQIALKPGLEELTFMLSASITYNFPCALLSDRVGNSLRCLRLGLCVLHRIVELGPLRSLTRLYLCHLSITWNELERVLSNSLALELLDLTSCNEIKCLKLSSALQRFKGLHILVCQSLRLIESKAPNLSSLYFRSGCKLDFSLVETWQMKKLYLVQSNVIYDARTKLPPVLPNIETLYIESQREVVDAPMLPTKFLYLKHLTIILRLGPDGSGAYDYFSLVSFLDASPSLETLTLDVTQRRMVHESIFVDSQLRHMPEHHHGHLKSVKISGFSSAKCLIELTCYILKNAVSLECLTLDTICGHRCYDEGGDDWCVPMADPILMETPRTLSAIRTYIENKVPSTVKLTVLEPCNKCHGKRLERLLSLSRNVISI
ncbi:FBD-associated F-box protein At3g52670-like [Triticum urartu]|uniref:FBD-associated F-box protein At3g52670-like n=1 Tax=Triticum urartu TaxID=4572 RepID=UPI002043DA70|nr:FBD-associated F-box protein At3g52670-like [Triticum urartu]